MAGADEAGASGLLGPLYALRANPTRRRWAISAAIVVGLLLAWVHWLGVFVGAALVALPTRSWPRGILAGFGFGVLAWLVFAASLALAGTLGPYLGTMPLLAISVASPVTLGLLGGLVRGVV